MSRFVGLTGLIIAGLVAVLCIADLAVGFPFRRVSVVVDAGFLVASLLLAAMSWSILDRRRA